MNMNFRKLMDPELRPIFTKMPELIDITADPTIARKMMKEMIAASQGKPIVSDKVTIEDRSIPGPEGSPAIPVRIYSPVNRTTTLPGLMWLHGGGFIVGDLDQDDLTCVHCAEEAECVVMSVDYRLAPEHPFPAGVEDCYAALQWMSASTEDMEIDGNRIAVGGASAGAGLAAAVALMARDRKGPPLIFQFLIYPCCPHMRYELFDPQYANRKMALWLSNLFHRVWTQLHPMSHIHLKDPGRFLPSSNPFF